MDDPQLQTILEQFTPEYQAIITSPVAELLAQSFAETFQLSEKEQTVLENSFRLYLMGIHSAEEWVDFVADFTSFDKQTAQVVVDQMQTHIADDIKLQIEEFRIGNTTESTTTPTSIPTPGSADSQTSETIISPTGPPKTNATSAPETPLPQQTPTNSASLSAVRTMQSDAAARKDESDNSSNETINKAPAAAEQVGKQPTPPTVPPVTEPPTHTTTSQADLLQKRKPVNPIPPPPAPTETSTPPRWESERSGE